MSIEFEKSKICSVCGASVSTDGNFCEHCGAAIRTPDIVATPEKPESKFSPVIKPDTIEHQGSEFVFPSPLVTPRIGRALGRAWDVLNRDMAGGIIVTLLYWLVSIAVAFAIPVIGYFGQTALMIGVFGWAEEMRRGEQSNIGSLFRIALNRFLEAIFLSLAFFLFWLLWVGPFIFAYFGLIVSMIGGIFTGIQSSGQNMDKFTPFMITTPVLFMFLISWVAILGIVIGPIIQAMTAMISWGIANGQAFTRSFNWAWECVKKNFFGWWLAGLVIRLVGGVGVLLCCVGVFVTLPWSILAWTEIMADTGED